MAQASTIRVLEQTRDRILIYQPPYWPFAIGFLIAALVIAVFVFVFMTLLSVRMPFRFVGCVLALPFLLFGLKAAVSQMFVRASRPEHSLTIRHAGLFGSHERVIRLDDIEAVVQLQARRSTGVGLRLGSGELVNLTGFTDQAGKSEMFAALELFLANERGGT